MTTAVDRFMAIRDTFFGIIRSYHLLVARDDRRSRAGRRVDEQYEKSSAEAKLVEAMDGNVRIKNP